MDVLERFRSFQTTSFGGIPAAQFFVDFYLWEVILNENPQLLKIIELGTWKGGFSLYLKAQAQARKISFSTYDSVNHMDSKTKGNLILNYYSGDIFAEQEILGETISFQSCALFCDNGNKPREIQTFAPYLTNDSIIVVHDWLDEIFPDDIPDYLEELYGSFCDDLGSKSRVFRKKIL